MNSIEHKFKFVLAFTLLTNNLFFPQSFNYLPHSPNWEIVQHTYYTLSYIEKCEQAEWVAYMLTTEMVTGGSERSNKFKKDTLVTTGSALPEDYTKSGYDRGHLCPAADMRWNKEAMNETFYMSNMSPQVPGFNRGIWKQLEEQVRNWVLQDDTLFICTGPILRNGLNTIGRKNKVSVPEQFYKIILDYTQPEIKMIAFLMDNESSKDQLEDFVVKTDMIEELTGIDFFPELPDSIEAILESRINIGEWLFETE